jgi:hypothetical protein
MTTQNWSRNVTFGAREVIEPSTVEKLQDAVAERRQREHRFRNPHLDALLG